MSIFETQVGFNRQALHSIDQMVIEGVLTDGIINPLSTVAGLRAVSFSYYETNRRFYEQYQKQIDKAEAIGVLNDAAVAGADDVAGLKALFTANDANLSTTGNYSYVG